MTLPAFQSARNVFCYLPLTYEVDTRPLVEHLLETRGVAAHVPITDVSSHMLHVAEIATMDDLTEGPFGILEPSEPTFVDPKVIDLWIVPGIAFDDRGYRIGQGGGFFDAFFNAHPTKAPKVAVAYAFQMVDRVPAEGHDVSVDLVVTEDQVHVLKEDGRC